MLRAMLVVAAIAVVSTSGHSQEELPPELYGIRAIAKIFMMRHSLGGSLSILTPTAATLEDTPHIDGLIEQSRVPCTYQLGRTKVLETAPTLTAPPDGSGKYLRVSANNNQIVTMDDVVDSIAFNQLSGEYSVGPTRLGSVQVTVFGKGKAVCQMKYGQFLCYNTLEAVFTNQAEARSFLRAVQFVFSHVCKPMEFPPF